MPAPPGRVFVQLNAGLGVLPRFQGRERVLEVLALLDELVPLLRAHEDAYGAGTLCQDHRPLVQLAQDLALACAQVRDP
jgi:hypothetical protein